MQSLKYLYKIGRGPSSSHTMGPEKACLLFKQKFPGADLYNVTLFGSLSQTGKGHRTDYAIEQAFHPKKVKVQFDCIIIDYLGLMQSAVKKENRVQEITEITRSLKMLAKDLKIPVVCCCQLSRGPESRTDKKPMLSDLRDSGAIEQDADIVMFLYRDEYYNKENSEKPGVCEINIAKNRSGPTDTVELTWVARYTKFSDMA